VLHSDASVSSFVLAIIVTTWYGGLRAGLGASAASFLSLAYLLFSSAAPSTYSAHLGRLALFSCIAAFLVWIIVSERRASWALRIARDELELNNDALARENLAGKALEQSLRRNESELRLVIDTIPAMAWSLLPDGRLEFLNRPWLDYTGLTLAEAIEDGTATLHPDDLANALARWKEAVASGQGYADEMRIRRADGAYRWFLVRTVPLLDPDGRVVRWYGTSTDIEDHKRDKESLHLLSRRLLQAHEDERRHFSRELHDQFGQLLATIGLHLQAARRDAGDSAAPSLEAAMAVLQRAGREVRNLALELRPTMLETAGLEATLKWLARETEERAGIPVRVVGRLGEVESDSAMGMFRIVQQAVANAIQHAEASHIWIELSHVNETPQVVVRDDGRGFDVARTSHGAPGEGHLGLLGMKERIQILGGHLQIESRPGSGTRVVVRLREPAAEPLR
jgi:PAS domain S-box-containing protein